MSDEITPVKGYTGDEDTVTGQVARPSSVPLFVTDLKPDDVLLGRGNPAMAWNKRFRDLILMYKPHYVSSGRHVVKGQISHAILTTISQRGGWFVRKIENPELRNQLGVPSAYTGDAYEVVDEETSLEKIKQALRERGSTRVASPKKTPSSGSLGTTTAVDHDTKQTEEK